MANISYPGGAPASSGAPSAISRARDFYGTPATVQPYSLFHGLFTYNVSGLLWRTSNAASGNGTATSVDGALTLTSGTVSGGSTVLESRRNLRYEPDRSIRYATATPGFPTGGAARVRFGQYTDTHGYFLVYDTSDGSLKLYTRNTTGIVAPGSEDHTDGTGAATTTDTLQATATLPSGADLTKATLFDIEAHWRGVGEIRCSINLVDGGGSARLGVSADLWSGNPGLPVRFEAIADEASNSKTFNFGCVDMASMGGQGPVYVPQGANIVETAFDNTERPILVIQAAGFLGGMPCTRDSVLRAVGYSVDAKATVRVYKGGTAASLASWANLDDSSAIIVGKGSVSSTWSATGAILLHEEPFTAAGVGEAAFDPNPTAITYISPIPGTLTTGANRGDPAYGDLIVVTVQKSTGGTVNCAVHVEIGEDF